MSTFTPALPTLDLAQPGRWEPVGGPNGGEPTVLFSHLNIDGYRFDIQAIAVDAAEEDAQGIPRAVDSQWDVDLDALSELAAADGPFQTVRIPGQPHDYVIVVYPPCR